MNEQTGGTGASNEEPRRKPTTAENVALTIKVLVSAGVVAALIWAVDSFVG